MTGWSDGYVTDIPYTSGFYRELAPRYLSFVAAAIGKVDVSLDEGQQTYCELACGRGFGTILLAAANPHMKFVGIDFNPEHVVFAQRLARRLGVSNVEFRDLSFEQASALSDDQMPNFDYVTLHGIYSWVSAENRKFITDFISKRLKVGGICFVSYNCLPGWSESAPLQRLVREYSLRARARSDKSVIRAIQFAQDVDKAGADYFRVNARARARVQTLLTKDHSYLAHEYLNGDWHPMYSIDVIREMADVKLSFVASAAITENMDGLCLSSSMQKVIAEIDDRGWAEMLRDFATNRQFRRDIFVKGPVRQSAAAFGTWASSAAIALTRSPTAIPLEFTSHRGKVSLDAAFYEKFLSAFGGAPKTLSALAASLPSGMHNVDRIVQASLILISNNYALPAAVNVDEVAVKSARSANVALAELIGQGQFFGFAVAGRAGTAVPVNVGELVALSCIASDREVAVEAVVDKARALLRAGQVRVKIGDTLLERGEEEDTRLIAQISDVLSKKANWEAIGAI